jgi:hypothetical protein
VVLPAVPNTNRGLIENLFLISRPPGVTDPRDMKRGISCPRQKVQPTSGCPILRAFCEGWDTTALHFQSWDLFPDFGVDSEAWIRGIAQRTPSTPVVYLHVESTSDTKKVSNHPLEFMIIGVARDFAAKDALMALPPGN